MRMRRMMRTTTMPGNYVCSDSVLVESFLVDPSPQVTGHPALQAVD